MPTALVYVGRLPWFFHRSNYILTVCPVIEYCGLGVQVDSFFFTIFYFCDGMLYIQTLIVLSYVLPFISKGGIMVLVILSIYRYRCMGVRGAG